MPLKCCSEIRVGAWHCAEPHGNTNGQPWASSGNAPHCAVNTTSDHAMQVRELLDKVLMADPRHHKALHLLALVEAGGDRDAKLRARQLWRC